MWLMGVARGPQQTGSQSKKMRKARGLPAGLSHLEDS
jgi:hypothetical protein